MRSHLLGVGLLLAAGCLSGGCFTAIKEGVGAVRGGQGTYVEIEPVGPAKEVRPLGEYTRFRIGTITDTTGGTVPMEIKIGLQPALDEALADEDIPNLPAGKTLLIRGEYLHYEDESLVGFVLGPLEEVIARLELVDEASGEVWGTANCIGRTTERVNKGVDKKTEGLARAIAHWIDARYPPREEG